MIDYDGVEPIFKSALEILEAPVSRARGRIAIPSIQLFFKNFPALFFDRCWRGFYCENHVGNNHRVLWFSPKALFMGLRQQETVLRTVQK
jgi:hypothetical protein